MAAGSWPQKAISAESVGRGKLLVASRRLGDPNFAQTVILLLEHSSQGAMGLVVNRPTRERLSALFPRVEGLQERAEALFLGGPVRRSQVLMLVRSNRQLEEAERVAENLYVSASRPLLERILAGSSDTRFRVFSGYAGWAAGQLEREVFLGDWLTLPYDEDIVFAAHPSSIWPKLIERGPLILAFQILGIDNPPYSCSSPWSPLSL
jgi:putative transcriptional regulator